MINRQLGKEKAKMVAAFIDLKVAFDMVEREILCGTLRKRGIREGLV